MVTAVVEVFVDDKRTYKTIDLRDLAAVAYPQLISVGIDTGLFDKDQKMIASNHYVKFKSNLCRLTIADGQVMIKHPKYGLVPLHKYAKECQIIR